MAQHPLKIKVCGLRDPGNIEEVCALQPDFAGYIFFPGSQRFVGTKPDPAIFRIPGRETLKVGVFVNEELNSLKEIFTAYRLDLVQLHGSESPAYSRALGDAGIPVIRSVNPGSVDQEPVPAGALEGARYLLFDTPGPTFGGTGRKFDWGLLEGLPVSVPFLLGGGIGPGDAQSIKRVGHPQLIGVDINSRFESSPGLKDVGLLGQFFMEIRTSIQRVNTEKHGI